MSRTRLRPIRWPSSLRWRHAPRASPNLKTRSTTRSRTRCRGDPSSNVEAGETERLGWRRRLDPTVVVVDAPVSMADRYWARDVIAALEPHAVWGVVDGGRKLEDLAAWSEIVGGVDALAVNGVQ